MNPRIMHSDWEESEQKNIDIPKLKSDWEEVNTNYPQDKPNNLKDFFTSLSANKGKSLSQTMPGFPEFEAGMKQGPKEALSAIPGIGKYFPQPDMNPPKDEGFFSNYNLGRAVGATPVIAGIAAPLAAGGEALGIPAALSQISAAGVGGALTTPGDAFNRGFGALMSMAPIGATKALGGILKILPTLSEKIDPKNLVKLVQSGHDVMEKRASDIFNFIKDEVKPRGVNKIDIPKNILDDAKSYLPNTRASSKLIEDAKEGDYEALHRLQSDLGKRGKKKLSSDLGADTNEGEEILDTRDKILESIKNKFNEYGHNDLSNLLDMGRSQWAKMKDLYYSRPSLAKMVDKDLRLTPKNPLSVFSEESEPMKKIWEAHPEIPKALKLNEEKKEMMKILKNAGVASVPIASTAGTLASLKYLLGMGKGKPEIDQEDLMNQQQ